MWFVLRDNWCVVLVLTILEIISFVQTVPSQRQTEELMLLDSLGRKGVMGSLENTQGALIDMLGRSRLHKKLILGLYCKLKIKCLVTTV